MVGETRNIGSSGKGYYDRNFVAGSCVFHYGLQLHTQLFSKKVAARTEYEHRCTED
jgi:hypothetical protein